MTAFQILDIKDFMSKLLIKETFDNFLLSDLSITTGVTYSIDGLLHPNFYSADEARALRETNQTHISWHEIKPFCFSVIKGKQTPLNFKIVFMLSMKNIKLLLEKSGLPISHDDIFGLYLNCQYNNGELTCVTGTSLRFFTLDKSLDHAWDSMMRKYLKQQAIDFDEV